MPTSAGSGMARWWRHAHYGRMPRSSLLLPFVLGLTVVAGLATRPARAADTAAANVRIYRCVGSDGAVALQNAPCTSGRQQVLDMQRPQDPPPRSAAAHAATAAPALPAREIRIVSVQPPQPMYECIADDGSRYTSDTGDGNPRWVPAWGVGYPVRGGRPGRPGGGPGRPVDPGSGSGNGHGNGHGPRYGGGAVVVPYGNVLVRDECHALPAGEVCARLADRRWELIRRYNSALQSERTQLAQEQRGIDARLAQDCGGP